MFGPWQMVKQPDSSVWILPSEFQTSELGEFFGSNASSGTLILLSGPTGIGKTSFCKGVARSLGIREVLTSPTFLTWQFYEGGRIPLFHGDLDRFKGSASEEFEWALTECSQEKLALVEWGERLSLKARDLFAVTIHLSFSWDGDLECPDRRFSFIVDSLSRDVSGLERGINLFLNDGKRWKA
ncbi:MAG: tRNA (adenosine(37)-N6)-threonylcarbamoyltransferase complex ATPase subunit type 1 TsaE [Leptospirillum sp.]